MPVAVGFGHRAIVMVLMMVVVDMGMFVPKRRVGVVVLVPLGKMQP